MNRLALVFVIVVASCAPEAPAQTANNDPEEPSPVRAWRRPPPVVAATKEAPTQDDEARKLDEQRKRDLMVDAGSSTATTALPPTHAEQCRSSYVDRFRNLQRVLEKFAVAKRAGSAKCLDYAAHCTTFSDGNYVCRGLTVPQTEEFGSLCKQWPHVTQWLTTEDEECADVDAAPVRIEWSWTDEEVRQIRGVKSR